MAELAAVIKCAPVWAKFLAGILGAAYVDANHGILRDLGFIKVHLAIKSKVASGERSDTTSMWYLFEKTALNKINTDEVCYVCEGKEWTWRTVYYETLQLARRFKDLGFKRKDVIGIFVTNKPAYPIIWLACMLIDVIPAFINTTLSSSALQHCLTASTAKTIIYDVELEPQLDTLDSTFLKSLLKIRWRDSFNGHLKGYVNPDVEFNEKDLQIKQEDLKKLGLQHKGNRDGIQVQDNTCLIFTSGTTGLPKPAACAHGRVTSGVLAWPLINGIRTTDRLYTCLPLYHSSGLWAAVAASWYSGNTVIIGRKFSASGFWKEVISSKATVIQYIGELMRFLVARPESEEEKKHNIRLAFGNGLRPEVWTKVRERFNIPNVGEFYGASEGNVAFFNYNTGPFSLGAIGIYGTLIRAITRKDVVIIKVDPLTEEPMRDSKGLCVRCETNEPGELVVRIHDREPSQRFKGYYGNEAATKKKILNDVLVKGDEYFRSGDLIRMDRDGLIYFVDRMGDTFRWKSENVSTNEVATVVSALEELHDVNVYGVQVPSHDGRAGCAAIVAPPNFDFSKLAKHVTRELPNYARPLFIRLVQEMQITGTIKHQKVHLRDEGIDLKKISDPILWLREGTYVPFGPEEYDLVKMGKVKL